MNCERELIVEAVQDARRKTLDLLQSAYGHHPNWRYIRSKILSIFGRDGLEAILNGTEHDGSCWSKEAEQNERHNSND